MLAQAPLPEGYALVVGSNAGGPGQASLRYAEDDAERVGEVLTTLGGFPRERVERLLKPSAAELRAAIERIRAQAEPLAQRGSQLRFFFYYSGHARADALNLGDEELPLTELRQRIVSLPSSCRSWCSTPARVARSRGSKARVALPTFRSIRSIA